ncbi:MAG: hypothetical protein H6649_13890 [Caldilineae bacterium]|nr:hypothetical protein [Anaerolineae bacterium]MCB0256085.1 hypothetical protein [Anaerolineae bacterium]MCB9155129.1 hypothetical protein [Caldilineae bacterium]
MSSTPVSILSKFYEQDSLHNTDDGFELVFRNRLAPTTLIGVGPLTIDGEQYSGEQVVIQLERPREGHSRPPTPIVRTAEQISDEKRVSFGVNVIARVAVSGPQLSPGPYRVALALRTKEVGDITVTADDEIVAEP